MPLPLFFAIGAAIAGATGLGAVILGTTKTKQAQQTMQSAKKRHDKNVARLEKENQNTISIMDGLGKLELDILESFNTFSILIEQIQEKPEFKTHDKGNISIPSYNPEELKNVSIGAGVLLAGLGGAALGTGAGFAAAGGTTAAVMAFGAASTGTAISALSGAAATNATLAALGGGAIAAGGGGIALGTMILGATTLGVGILVGGIVFSVVGYSLSNKADEAHAQTEKAESEINKICTYLTQLAETAQQYYASLTKVNDIYQRHIERLTTAIEKSTSKKWSDFSDEEKLNIENTVLLVRLLYSMCKVKLVLASEAETEVNQVNSEEVERSITNANRFISERGLSGI